MEFHEVEITEPKPLRVVKRYQTTSNRPASDETFDKRCSSFGSSIKSKGSPPTDYEWPVTISKKRNETPGLKAGVFKCANVSGFDTGFDISAGIISSQKLEFESRESMVIDMDLSAKAAKSLDQEMTPKAGHTVSRTTSTGAFLKSDLHQRSSQIDATRFSVREKRNSLSQRRQEIPSNFGPIKPPPAAPERRSSKSKTFFQLALNGRNHQDIVSINPDGQKKAADTTNKLIRRVSRKRNSSPDSLGPSAGNGSYDGFYINRSSDSTDINIQLSSSQNSLETSLSSSLYGKTNRQSSDPLVLCPEIRITPEVTSVDTREFDMWAAIEIRGILRRPNRDFDGYEKKDSQVSIGSTKKYLSDFKSFGCLDSMQINIEAGEGCHISKIIGDYHGPLTIKAYQTHLILVKLRFDNITPCRDHEEISSDQLILELQSDLEDILLPFLKVQLRYQHSGFKMEDPPRIHTYGIDSHVTLLQTEATAMISRYNHRSIWSSRPRKATQNINLILWLIETNFHPLEARDATRQISGGTAEIASSEILWQSSVASADINETSKISSPISTHSTLGSLYSSSPEALDSNAFPPHVHLPREVTDEIDPARKIWVEMRRSSRSNYPLRNSHPTHRRNLGDGRESRSCLTHASRRTIPTKGLESEVEQERVKIMEWALRNKRSLGEETLRSMAPSVFETHEFKEMCERGNGSGVDLGSGVARNWWMGLFLRS